MPQIAVRRAFVVNDCTDGVCDSTGLTCGSSISYLTNTSALFTDTP